MVRLKAAAKKVTPKQKEELQEDTNELVNCYEKAMTEMESVPKRIETLKVGALSQVQASKAEVDEKFSQRRAKAEEQLEAIAYLQQMERKAVRKVQMQDRYKRLRVANKLLAKGFKPQMAKHLAAIIEGDDFGSDAASAPFTNKVFSPHVVGKWSATTEGGEGEPHQLHSPLDKILRQYPETVQALMDKLAKTINENDEWLGAMSKLSYAPTAKMVEELGLDAECESAGDLGVAPWLVATKPNTWRFGPANWPLPGVGGFAQALNDNMVLVLFKAEDVISNGIAIGEMQAFCETEKGKGYLASASVRVVCLSRGDLVWVPFGWIAPPLYVPVGDANEQKYGFLINWSFFASGWAAETLEPSWLATSSWITDHLEMQGTSKQWSRRSEVFKNFVGSVASARRTT